MSHDAKTLIGLVSQYSPSGGERGAVEWLVSRMQDLGYGRAEVDPAGNAVGVMGGGSRQVVLLGHIDTVPGEIPVSLKPGSSTPRGPHPSDRHGVLFGRGSVDAKGSLACFTDAVARVGERDGWQFVVIGAVEEERNSDGARFVADHYKPDFAIIGEPNRWDRIGLGYKGSAWATVTVTRGQAHSASGEITAAESAVETWLKIKAHVDAFNFDKRKIFDKLLLTLHGLDSQTRDFEQRAVMKIGVRLPLDVTPDDWYASLIRIADGAQVEPTGIAVPAWECEKNSKLVRVFLNGIRSQGGQPRFVYKTGTADLNIVAPIWGCPAVVYGPGDSSLDHTPNEHLELEEYERAVEVLAEVLLNLAG